MSFTGFLSRRKDERSASDVIKDFQTRIENFLRHEQVNKSEIVQQPGDALEKLFYWSDKTHRDKNKIQQQLLFESQTRQKVEQQRNGLESELASAKREIHNLRNEIIQVVADHSKEIYQREENHRKELYQLKEKHRMEIERKDKEHGLKVTSMEDTYKRETNRLKGQLLVNVPEHKSWADDRLKLQFKELKMLVNEMTAPTNFTLNLPSDHPIQLEFDPTGFLYSAGGSNFERAHFLLKSTIWSIIKKHFFDAPFGFGVLGPRGIRSPLFRTFASWFSVIHGTSATDSTALSDIDNLDIFRNDGLANDWRSSFFQTTYRVIINSDTLAGNETAQLSSSNLDSAIKAIADLFATVSRYCSTPYSAPTDEIRRAMLLAREVAHQFGVNPAQLKLLNAARGEKVVIGKQFQDCYDADNDAGALYTVNLVISPGLQKVGDGKKDWTTVSPIVPCEIFRMDA